MNKLLFALTVMVALAAAAGLARAEVNIINVDVGGGVQTEAIGISSLYFYKISQSFSINGTGFNLNHIDVRLKKAQGATMKDIYGIVENNTGTPTANVIGNPIKGCTAIITSFTTTSYDWKNLTFTGCSLQADKMYWLVLNTTSTVVNTDGNPQYVSDTNSTASAVNGNQAWWNDGGSWISKASTKATFRVWGDYVYPAGVGLNLTIFNAWNTSGVIPDGVYTDNGTYSIYNTTATNIIQLSADYSPTGFINVTIVKSGYPNVTYTGLPVNDSALLNFTAYTTHLDDIVHINSPLNASYFSASVVNNYSTATYFGNIFTIKYSLDNGVTNTTVNTSSSSYFSTVTNTFTPKFLRVFATHSTGIINRTELNASVNYNMIYSQFNINIRDEITGNWLNITGKNVTLSVQCTYPVGYINYTVLTSASTLNFTLGCVGSAVMLTINDTSPMWGAISQFRIQQPSSGIGNLTFYMINTTQNRPVYYRITISDFLSQWTGALLTITKAVPVVGSQTMVSQTLDVGGNVNTWLIDGEKYTITLTSADGRRIRNTGDLLVSYLYPSQTISVFNLTLVPEQNNAPAYQFDCTGSGITGVNYFDILNQTSSVTLTVYYINNQTQLYSSTLIAANSTNYFSLYWNGIPTNFSVTTKITAVTQSYGTITETRSCYWIGIGRAVELGLADAYYTPIALFLIIVVALLFSLYSVNVGSVVTLFFAGMLWMWGWLPATYTAVMFLGAVTIMFIKFRASERR